MLQLIEFPCAQSSGFRELRHRRNRRRRLYERETTHGSGPEPYAPLAMFKLLPLGQGHGLSGTQLEHALKVRMDSVVFTGFDPDGIRARPTATTSRPRALLT